MFELLIIHHSHKKVSQIDLHVYKYREYIISIIQGYIDIFKIGQLGRHWCFNIDSGTHHCGHHGNLFTHVSCPLSPSLSVFFSCMFNQLLRVQHSCSSTESWGSVLPSVVETRDQNPRGCPLLFSNRNLGSFFCIGDRNPIHPQPLGSCGPLQE